MQKANREEFNELKHSVQSEGKEVTCPIWPDSTARMQNGTGPLPKATYWSPRAGGLFRLSYELRGAMLQLDEVSQKRISSWIWEKNSASDVLGGNDTAELPILTAETKAEACKRPLLTTEQRIDRALHAIGGPGNSMLNRLAYRVGDPEGHNRQMQFEAATECGKNKWEMDWLLQELEDYGYVRLLPLFAKDTGQEIRAYGLTLKGITRLETGGTDLASNTAFIAMWFDDRTKDAYEKGIKPAVAKAGYKPMRIDRKEHSNKICDEIVAEVRRARFLVCDFTCGLLPDKTVNSGETAIARGGVYYEAGFAHGLGKPVIWTCRSDLINHVHFDLRQYNCILWEVEKEDELQKAVLNRIRAVIA